MVLEDKLAICEVIARYSYTWDGKDADGFAGLFVEEAVWELVGPEATEPQVRLESRSDIHAWAIENFEGRLLNIQARHHQSATVFDELTLDAARTRTMVLVTNQGSGEAVPRPVASGVYYDKWRKTQTGWQFAHRILRRDSGTP
jgi:hypothetical protein